MAFNKIKASLALGAVMGFAPFATAGEFQLSGGGEYMIDSADSEFAFTMATARGAYFFNENMGIELEASVGTSEVEDYAGTGTDWSLSNQYGGYFVYRGDVGAQGEFFGRIGFRAGELEFEGTDFFFTDTGVQSFTFNDTTSYNGFSLGAGYTHYFTDNVGLRGEVTTSGASLDSNLDPDGNFTSFAASLVVKF